MAQVSMGLFLPAITVWDCLGSQKPITTCLLPLCPCHSFGPLELPPTHFSTIMKASGLSPKASLTPHSSGIQKQNSCSGTEPGASCWKPDQGDSMKETIRIIDAHQISTPSEYSNYKRTHQTEWNLWAYKAKADALCWAAANQWRLQRRMSFRNSLLPKTRYIIVGHDIQNLKTEAK